MEILIGILAECAARCLGEIEQNNRRYTECQSTEGEVLWKKMYKLKIFASVRRFMGWVRIYKVIWEKFLCKIYFKAIRIEILMF